MTRWLWVLLLCAGCGSANPVDPEPQPPSEIAFDHVMLADLNAYIAQINGTFSSVDILFNEYGWITSEATTGLVTTYWSRQFTQTMIGRIHALLARLHDMRPENPVLLRLHVEELEAAFEDYLDGVTYFEQNLDFLSSEVLEGLNARMGQGNVHIIRLQIFLSDLAGRDVVLGEPVGQTDEGQGIGL